MSSNDHDGQSLILYTVQCVFTGDPSVADDWVGWLREEHLQDVMAAGANSAELLRMDGDQLTYEVRYRFPSRERSMFTKEIMHQCFETKGCRGFRWSSV